METGQSLIKITSHASNEMVFIVINMLPVRSDVKKNKLNFYFLETYVTFNFSYCRLKKTTQAIPVDC